MLQVKATHVAEAATTADRTNDIIDEKTLLDRLPVSPRTLRNWREKGLLPFIRLPDTRRVLYSWGAVHATILRRQRGGVQ